MSTTVNLAHPEIVALNAAVALVFECRPAQVCSVQDCEPKFMAVFILVQLQGYRPCDIARPYSINCLFVNTVVGYCMKWYACDEDFRKKVHQILNEIEDVAQLDA